jgi:hypothetical protein
MAPEQKPSIGRIVHFKTRGSADGAFPPRDFAAIITTVHNDTNVNLATFGDNGLRFEHSVPQGDQPGNWNWPPRV